VPWPDLVPVSRGLPPEPPPELGDVDGTAAEDECELAGGSTGLGAGVLWVLWLVEVDVDTDVVGSGEGFPPTFPGGVGFGTPELDVDVETAGSGEGEEDNEVELEGTLQRLTARLASCPVRF